MKNVKFWTFWNPTIEILEIVKFWNIGSKFWQFWAFGFLEVLGTKYLVPSTWYQVRGTNYVVPSTWYQVRDTKYLVASTWYQVPGTKYLVPSTWYQVLGTNGAKYCIWASIAFQIGGQTSSPRENYF